MYNSWYRSRWFQTRYYSLRYCTCNIKANTLSINIQTVTCHYWISLARKFQGAMCRWPMRCTVLINNFYSAVFSCSTCFEQFTRSSSGALPNILYYTVWYNRSNHASQSSCYEVVGKSYLPLHSSQTGLHMIVPNCVIQYIRQCPWWWTSKLFETCRARKNGGIKVIYKNCASSCSSTHRTGYFC